MSYIVEQKIKGNIYLYEVESYRDKNKKQPRQRRKYIGPKNAKKKSEIRQKESRRISRNFGNIFLLNFLSDKPGIGEILRSLFPECRPDILAPACFEIIGGSPLYLFPYRIDEQYLPGAKKLHSSRISNMCGAIGRAQAQRYEFIQKRVGHIKPINGVYYDIASISGYNTNIGFIEWGYNRDKEHLPQLNTGAVFCQNSALPIFYNIYPGSMVDVTTLKNCIRHLTILKLKEIMSVSDRGFFSGSDISELNKEKNTEFIPPLPFRLEKVKHLLEKSKKILPIL